MSSKKQRTGFKKNSTIGKNSNSQLSEPEVISLFQQGLYTDFIAHAESSKIFIDKFAIEISQAAYMTGNFEKCASYSESLYPHHTDNPAFISTYASALRKLGNYNLAKTIYTQSLHIYPNDPLISNNYANLLVDCGEFDLAIATYKSININSAPNRTEILNNLRRAEYMRSLTITDQTVSTPTPSDTRFTSLEALPGADPLFDAFTIDEVLHSLQRYSNHNGKELVKPTLSTKNASSSSSSSSSSQCNVTELIASAWSAVDDSPDLALATVKTLYKLHASPLDVLHTIAATAYLNLHDYHKAEVYFLLAFSLGSTRESIFINLASLAAMRHDDRSALHWLTILEKSNPKSQYLAKARKSLFPDSYVCGENVPY